MTMKFETVYMLMAALTSVVSEVSNRVPKVPDCSPVRTMITRIQ